MAYPARDVIRGNQRPSTHLHRHAASPTRESRNMDCSSAYATEVGARSCEKRGER